VVVLTVVICFWGWCDLLQGALFFLLGCVGVSGGIVVMARGIVVGICRGCSDVCWG